MGTSIRKPGTGCSPSGIPDRSLPVPTIWAISAFTIQRMICGRSGHTGYGISEIRALTFSPDDRFLLVITRNGSLDCFDLEEGTFVYSEQPDVFNTYRYPYVDRLACMAGADDRYLYLKAYDSDDSYGLWLSLDQTSWTLAASSDLVFAALPADGCLYKWHEHTLYRYPIHSLEDLAAAALEKPGRKRRQTRPNKKCRKERTDKKRAVRERTAGKNCKKELKKKLKERTVKKGAAPGTFPAPPLIPEGLPRLPRPSGAYFRIGIQVRR